MDMKKILLPLMMLLMVASCKQDNQNNPAEPTSHDTKRVFFCPELSGCIDLPYGADANLTCLELVFATEGISFFGKETKGNGKMFTIIILTDNIDASTFFPATGTYTVSNSLRANTVYVSSVCHEMVDGVKSSDHVNIDGGSMTISGNADNCTINLNFDGFDEYVYQGQMSFTDKRTMQSMNFYQDYSYYLGAPGDYFRDHHYLLYTFFTNGVTIDSEGYPHGNGKIFYVYFLSDDVNQSTFFPSTGTYTVSSNKYSKTVIAGDYDEDNYSTYYSFIYNIANDEIESEEPITSGSMSISGNAYSSTVSLDNINYDGHIYTYDGPINVSHYLYRYEPKTSTTINITSTNANLTKNSNSARLEFTATNGMYCAILLYSGSNLYRDYTVGSDKNDHRTGMILYSAGCDDQYVYLSYFSWIDEEGYINVENGVYSVVGGNMTISNTGYNSYSATGTFTTYYGTIINVNIFGNIVQNSAKGPRHDKIGRLSLQKTDNQCPLIIK